MKNQESVGTGEVAKKATRKKSPETALKQEMTAINREMAKLAKTLESFKEMQKEVDGAEARKAELNLQLDVIKVELRKVLGLD